MCILKDELEKQAYYMYAINEMRIMINTLERKFYLSDLENIHFHIDMDAFDNLKLIDIAKELKKKKNINKLIDYVKNINSMLDAITNKQTELLSNYNLCLIMNEYDNIQFKS